MAMTREDLEALHEDWDFEAKKAAGRDGLGKLPDDFWPTYSAMANTHGGTVALGVKERKDGSLELHGIGNPDRVKFELWDQIRNPQRVSANLLGRDDVQIEEIEGLTVLLVRIPQAQRADRPVYINNDLWRGTYVRIHDGDCRAKKERIRRMVAEAEYDSRDSRVFSNFTLEDLNAETVRAYRQVFLDKSADHPWLPLDDEAFLTKLGALVVDRETGKSGVAAAGLLMFGQLNTIREAFPNYFVDFQQRVDHSESIQWSDRVYPDGRWSGNLYDFYRRVITKLTADLAVPFKLRSDLYREDETHVHEALREALVNTLIHPDYEGRTSVVVLRFLDGFEFRNPGGLRLPIEQIRLGGVSDCRNRRLQQMFLRVGLGEQAGSGFSRILRAWNEQHWRAPHLAEDVELEITHLRLSMTSLLPPEVLIELETRFGSRFGALEEAARLAVATAAIEGRVTNRRMQEISDLHPRDLTFMFRDLVSQGFLQAHGRRSGTWYTLPGTNGATEGSPQSSPQTSRSSPQTSRSSPQTSSSSKSGQGQFLATEEDPVEKVREGRWAPQETVREAILVVCATDHLTVQEIARTLKRATKTIQENYLNLMVREGQLELRHPDRPNHPDQAYRKTQ